MIEIINVSKKYKKYVVPFNSLKSFFLNHKKYKEENNHPKHAAVLYFLQRSVQVIDEFQVTLLEIF